MPGSIPRVKSVEAIRLHFQSHHTVKVISLQTHLPDKQSLRPKAEESCLCLLPRSPVGRWCCLTLQTPPWGVWPARPPAEATTLFSPLQPSWEPLWKSHHCQIQCSFPTSEQVIPIPWTASNLLQVLSKVLTRPLKCSATHVYLLWSFVPFPKKYFQVTQISYFSFRHILIVSLFWYFCLWFFPPSLLLTSLGNEN